MLSNVLVVGNMDADEMALVKATLGPDAITASHRESSDGEGLTVYESVNPLAPLRLIDARGIESSMSDRARAARAAKAWSERVADDDNPDTNINAIWFCVDMTPEGPSKAALRALSRVVKFWESLPLIAVITQTCPGASVEDDVRTLHDALSRHKRLSKNLKDVVCLVAQDAVVDADVPLDPEASTNLVAVTVLHLPAGIRAAENDIRSFQLVRKRALRRRTIAAFSAAGSLATVLPLPLSDALVLTVLEAAELDALAQIYEVRQENTAKKLLDMVVELGGIGLAAHASIRALSLIPGVRLKTGVTNALIAGLFIALIGEGASLSFERVYMGKVKLDDLGWVRKFMESEIPQSVIEQLTKAIDPAVKQADGFMASGAGKVLTDLAAGVFARA